VLTIGLKFRGFKPGRKRRIVKSDEIRSSTSIGGKVKPSAPRRKILRRVKNSLPGLATKCLLHQGQINLVDESGMIRTRRKAQ
jgi:hypothetical protein